MRSLHRNNRTLYYANQIGTQPIYDAYGNDTLEVEAVYDAPTSLKCNISANAGTAAVEAFGSQTEYSRTVSIVGECPLVEGSKIWFGVTTDKANNYVVVKVADSKYGYLVALREVSAR